MRPLAIIPCYNEADILPWVLRHLIVQGCEPYLLDNWSTDGSVDIARDFGVHVELCPVAGPSDAYEWTLILHCAAAIAARRSQEPRWVMLHDADEIRRAHAGFSLAKGFLAAQAAGYNAVSFRAVTFVPIDNSYDGGPLERHFRHFRTDHVDQRTLHIKAWLQQPGRLVDLATHGGHQAVFPGRKVFPAPFLLKHYPIRSQQHGLRKVLRERLPRYAAAEREKNWHVQYDEYTGQSMPDFLGLPEDLRTDLEAYLRESA